MLVTLFVTLQGQSSLRLVKVLTGEFMRKNLCSIFKFVYRQVKRRVLLSFKLFVIFQYNHNIKYSRYQDYFVVQSWYDGLFIYSCFG